MQDYGYIFYSTIQAADLLILAFGLVYLSNIIARSKQSNNYFLPIAALPLPAKYLALYLCVVFSFQLFHLVFSISQASFITHFLSVSAFWVVSSVYLYSIYECWLSRKLSEVDVMSEGVSGQTDNNTLLIFMSYVFKLLLFLFASIGIAHHIGYGLTGLLTIKAVVVVIISFAAEKFIKNNLYGLLIRFDHLFQESDKVRFLLDGKRYRGRIYQISLRTVRIKLEDYSIMVVPCSHIHEMGIANKSMADLRSKSVIIRVMYEHVDKIDLIERHISEFLTEDLRVGPNRFIVSLVSLDDSSVNIEVKFYAKKRLNQIRGDLLLHVVDIYHQNNIPFSMPVVKSFSREIK